MYICFITVRVKVEKKIQDIKHKNINIMTNYV